MQIYLKIYEVFVFQDSIFLSYQLMCCVIICNGSFSIGEYMAYGAICIVLAHILSADLAQWTNMENVIRNLKKKKGVRGCSQTTFTRRGK